ncbi:MAG: hypothetical protein OEY72_08225 [Gammaproteobacteria bacterium]|nr:hypothetical protein [Gammaproteobacteria bacterium]
MNKLIANLSIIVASFLPLTAAWTSSPLQGELSGFRVVLDDKRQERLVAADTAEPGDIIEYHLEYHNTTGQAVEGVVVTGPVPANTFYVDGSGAGGVQHRQTVSVDGGASFESEPVKRVVQKPNGVREEIILPPSDYTHLQWLLQSPVAGGERIVFRYRVQVR